VIEKIEGNISVSPSSPNSPDGITPTVSAGEGSIDDDPVSPNSPTQTGDKSTFGDDGECGDDEETNKEQPP
jgi:hypothetical protein